MAGAWPDLPNPRIEYDRDGTRVYSIANTGVVTELGATAISDMNDENSVPRAQASYTYIAHGGGLLVFPYLMDISHVLVDLYQGTPNVIFSKSTDSTTGVDGTWTTFATIPPIPNALTEQRYRTDIAAVSGGDGVKMLKVKLATGSDFNLRTLHLYGKPTAGQGLHRLTFWHPTLDEPLDNHPAHLDWGNVQQGSSAVRQFRVKNVSPSLTASGVKVFMQSLTEANPTQVSQHTLSGDGSAFVPAASPGLGVGVLAPGAISPVLHIKRTTSPTAQLTLWRQRLVVAADTWSA